ncbi:MAG: hypothetical protein HGA85_01035 [Nanoarchaeota archaeon]|nr:hypothetical protein [Nanoarchaeota archaeon]
MQVKRSKRTRARAANKTAGHGSKKKNRGSGARGGAGFSSSGKRGSAKMMRVNKLKFGGAKTHLGRNGFTSLKIKGDVITLEMLQSGLRTLVADGKASMVKEVYTVDLTSLGFAKLLSKGSVVAKMTITVPYATDAAISKVEAAGGKIILPTEKSEEHK